MKGWDRTVKQIIRTAHQEGCMDVLRAVLDEFEKDPHVCVARDWAERMWQDPEAFADFVRDSQNAREGR